jgi:hypothetical protein
MTIDLDGRLIDQDLWDTAQKVGENTEGLHRDQHGTYKTPGEGSGL